jgi:hypothetical protein
LSGLARASALLAFPMMRSTRSRLLLLAALMIATGMLGSVARAQECSVDCGLQHRACMREARTAMGSCQTQCKQGDSSAACIRTCVAGFVDAKDVCRRDLGGCLGGCDPRVGSAAPQASGCQSGCGRTLAGCSHDVRLSSRQCIRGCADSPDRDACVSACNASVDSRATQCRGALRTCLAGCGTPAGSSKPGH